MWELLFILHEVTPIDYSFAGIRTTRAMDEQRGDHLELFLQEIEAVDDYWGPTFRAIYQPSSSSTDATDDDAPGGARQESGAKKDGAVSQQQVPNVELRSKVEGQCD